MTETVTSPEIPSQPAPEKPFVKGKFSSAIAFGVAIILFFLPFIDIRCNNISLKKISGAELATGYKVSGPGMNDGLFNGLENTGTDGLKGNFTVSQDKKGDPNIYALVALVLGGLGLLLSISNLRAGGIGGVVTGSLAAASLAGLFIDIRRQAKASLSEHGLNSDVNIAVDFTPWFYIALIAFIVAAALSYKRMKT